MRVLIVGGGGREHAIVWKLAESQKVTKLYCAPGNAGIANHAECVPIKADDLEGICDFAVSAEIDMAVIGPEVPLAMGMVDALESSGRKAGKEIMVFGPNKKCSQLEASKSFTKGFLARHKIPTAGYREFKDKEELLENIGIFGFPMVLKADGLAAGKGVIIAANKEEARKGIESLMGSRDFGTAGDKVVVEEFLRGVEASVLCFVDEKTIIPMEPAQDYKRIFSGDEGPNTGGMGTYSPSLVFDEKLEKRIRREILDPTLEGFRADGLDFKGVLFIGLMIQEDGSPKVIEFNNRFGDPEAQSVLPRMETDLMDVLVAVCKNRLSDISIRWSKQKAVCVVAASGGYPGEYMKGIEIKGLAKNGQIYGSDAIVFHAGTAMDHICHGSYCGQTFVTAGGRVLGVTALGDTHEEARKKAYENMGKISFDDMQYRDDIGLIHLPGNRRPRSRRP